MLQMTAFSIPSALCYKISNTPNSAKHLQYVKVAIGRRQSIMPRSSDGSMPFISIAVCLVIAALCMLAPVEEFRRVVIQRCFASWEQLYDPSENLFQNYNDNFIYWMLRPFIKFFFKLFANCGKEIVFIVLVVHFYPTLKGTYIL